MRAKPRNPGKIRDNDCEIEWSQCDLGDCNRIKCGRSALAMLAKALSFDYSRTGPAAQMGIGLDRELVD
jgi:hypothetical protein